MVPLQIRHITKRYGPLVAVDDLSFTIEPGRVTGFLGPNGSGKSTTMKILLDLASADQGSATIGKSRYRELDDPARTVGVILEPNAFHPGRTGRNHLRALADGAGVPQARVDPTLREVGLADAAGRRVGTYSLGMKQRLSLAAALLGDPGVLVLDEPGNGLDPEGIRWLRHVLRARAAMGHTVFVSSHLLAEMELLADEVVVIHHGRLVTSGTVAELRTAETTVRTPSSDELQGVLARAGGLSEPQPDGSIRVRGLTAAEIGDRALAAGIALHELSPHAGSLEQLFLAWTAEAGAGDATVPSDEAVAA